MNTPDSPDPLAPGHLQSSLRPVCLWIFGALFLLALAQVAVSLWNNRLETALTAGLQQRHELDRVVNELRTTAEESSRMAARFVLSGDPLHAEFYEDLLAIRDGRKPRPANYDKVYWELVVAARRQPPASEPARALATQLETAGFTAGEEAKLRESLQHTEKQVQLERIAINAVKGVYSDAAGQFTRPGAPNRAYAAQVLNSPEYQQARARVMRPVREVQVVLAQRTSATLTRLQGQAAGAARVEMVLLIAGVVLVALAFVVLNRRIITPVLELATAAAGVGRNGFFRRVLVTRKDELGTLAGALNRMSETVEEKLGEAAAYDDRFRGVFEALPEPVVLLDAAGRLVLANWPAEALLGYARHELAGLAFEALLPESTRNSVSLVPGPAREVNLLRKDKQELSVELSFHPVTGPAGGEWLCGVLRDRQAQSAAEAETARQRQQQAALLDAIPHPIFITDAEARLTGCNRAGETVLGLNRDELAGRLLLDVADLPEWSRAVLQEEAGEAVRALSQRHCELSFAPPDQPARVFACSLAGFRHPDGAPGGAVGVLVDITERREAEAALLRERRLNQTLLDNTDAAIHVKDTEGRYLFANASHAALFGRPVTDFPGRTATDLFGRKAGSAHEQADREVRRTREARLREELLESDGQQRHFITHLFPLVDEHGELSGTAGVATDITELKALRAEITRLREALPNAGRELRPPLGLIAELTRQALATEPGGRARRHVSMVDSFAHGLLSLLDGVADTAQAGAERVQTSLRKLLEEMAESLRTNAPTAEPEPMEAAEKAVAHETQVVVVPVTEPVVEADAVSDAASEAHDPPTPEPEPVQTEAAPPDDEPPSGDMPPAAVNMEPAPEPAAEPSRSSTPNTGAETPVVTDADEPQPVAEQPAPASAPGDETPRPEKKKRAARKKPEKPTAQPDLFGGGYSEGADDAGPIRVTVDPDGVPVVPGLDLRDAMNRLALPADAVRAMAVRFAHGLAGMFLELRTALETQDHEASRRHAHAIAGAAGELSADTLRRLAKTLELAIKFEQGDTRVMLVELEREAARLHEGIRQLEALEESPPVEEPATTSAAAPAARQILTMLEELAAALEEGDFEAISLTVTRLKTLALPPQLQADYDRLRELVDDFDHAEAAAVVRSMQERVR